MTDDRKRRILRAAEKLFSHYGSGKTTIADIARACDIGVGSVYLDFQSKQAILRALSEEKAKLVGDRVAQAAARPGPLRDKLAAMLVARVAALLELAEGGEHRCELVRCGQDKGPAFGASVRAELSRVLQAAADTGALRAGSVEQAMATLELAFAGLSPPLLYDHDRQQALAQAALLAEVVAGGLLGEDAG